MANGKQGFAFLKTPGILVIEFPSNGVHRNSPSSIFSLTQTPKHTTVESPHNESKDHKFLNSLHAEKDLTKFVNLSTKHFFDYIFPLDWRESLSENMISLRSTEISRSLLEEVILEKTRSKSNCLSYGEIGTVALIILGSGQLNTELYDRILECLHQNEAWEGFIANLKKDIAGSDAGYIKQVRSIERLIIKFHEALQYTFNANWRKIYDYMSPVCLLYLVERYLMLLSFSKGYFFTTKTTFVEWLIYRYGRPWSTSSFVPFDKQSLEDILKFIVDMVRQFLYCEKDTVDWIRKSRINYVEYYHSLLVLRSVIIICFNFGLILDLLGQKRIRGLLPREFCDALLRRKQGYKHPNIDVNMLVDAFKKIGNPIVIVSMQGNCPNIGCKDAIFVDMKVNPCKEEILKILFPKTESSQYQTAGICSEVFPPVSYDEGTCLEVVPSSSSISLSDQDVSDLPLNQDRFWELIDALKAVKDIKDQMTMISYASTLRVYLGKFVFIVDAGMKECLQKKPEGDEDGNSWDAISIRVQARGLLFS